MTRSDWNDSGMADVVFDWYEDYEYGGLTLLDVAEKHGVDARLIHAAMRALEAITRERPARWVPIGRASTGTLTIKSRTDSDAAQERIARMAAEPTRGEARAMDVMGRMRPVPGAEEEWSLLDMPVIAHAHGMGKVARRIGHTQSQRERKQGRWLRDMDAGWVRKEMRSAGLLPGRARTVGRYWR